MAEATDVILSNVNSRVSVTCTVQEAARESGVTFEWRDPRVSLV